MGTDSNLQMLEKGQGHAEAMIAAEKGIKSQDEQVKQAALELKALVEKAKSAEAAEVKKASMAGEEKKV